MVDQRANKQDPVYAAINEVRELVIEMSVSVKDVPVIRADVAALQIEQAEHRGAIRTLKWLFPTTMAAIAAGCGLVGLIMRAYNL